MITNDNGIYQVNLDDKILASFVPPPVNDNINPAVRLDDPVNGWQKVIVSWDLPEKVGQNELSIKFSLGFTPDFWWAPHLAPEDGYVIGQHVFRAPAVIAQKESLTFVIVPDLDLTAQNPDNPWFLDLDAPKNEISIGLSKTSIPVHVLFKKEPGMILNPGKIELSFYISVFHDNSDIKNPWTKTANFLWDKWARPLFNTGEPLKAPMDNYVRHTYNWAFDSWKDTVWQEFEHNGRKVGAPQFIVIFAQSPNYNGEHDVREFLSIWNQAWFSSLRSASGLFRYARRTGNNDLADKARLAKELALAAPMKDGLFPSVIRTDNITVTIDGKEYQKPKGWDDAYWTNSNRCPVDHGISDDWYHILDSSWTCLLMLRWYEELEQDKGLLDYSIEYADKLITLQDNKGFFPGWLHPQTLQPGPVMNQTPETSMSVTFLLKLAALTGDEKYKKAALKAMDAVLEEIVPAGRWEDFETYWSCCRWGRDKYIGKKIERNDMYKQNNFSIFWTAEALLDAWRATGNEKYRDWGRRTLDELSMCQQVWKPSFIYVPALGGFGVMNCDGEWTDSRQSLFAELFMEYYKESGDPHLFERGICALRSSFIMMYCPENDISKKHWEVKYPWFGPEDYGFMMENYGHEGKTNLKGEGIGIFTIYDWGNGAASEGRNRVHDHYGDVFINRKLNHCFGIDSIKIEKLDSGWQLTDQVNSPRNIKIVYEDNSTKSLTLNNQLIIK